MAKKASNTTAKKNTAIAVLLTRRFRSQCYCGKTNFVRVVHEKNSFANIFVRTPTRLSSYFFPINILPTRFPSGKFVGEWRKDTLSPPDAMTIYYTHKKKLAPKK